MTEHANPVSLHRRVSDPPEEDFRKSRRYEEREVILERQMDTYSKWIVGVVGAGIITLLSVLALRDRQSIDQTMVHLNSRQTATDVLVQRHETELQLLRQGQADVAADVKEMRADIKAMREAQDRLLVEIRRAR